jgi:hypothetical protein
MDLRELKKPETDQCQLLDTRRMDGQFNEKKRAFIIF